MTPSSARLPASEDSRSSAAADSPASSAVMLPSANAVAPSQSSTTGSCRRKRCISATLSSPAKVEALEIELNRDETTGVANRRYFLNEFRRALEAGAGHVLILHLHDLAGINRHAGRRPTDQWLTITCQRLGEILNTSDQPSPPLLARLNGADFAILLPESTHTAATELAGRIRTHLLATRIASGENELCRWAMSLGNYVSGTTISAVLTRLDEGLTQAEENGTDEVVLAVQ